MALFAFTVSTTVRQATTLEVRAGESSEVTLNLVPGTILRVRALDSAGKNTIARRIHVQVHDSQDRPWSHGPPGPQSSSRRTFGPLPEGDYAVSVAFGSKTALQTVHVGGEKQQEIVVREPD